jgi:hypothetical protein
MLAQEGVFRYFIGELRPVTDEQLTAMLRILGSPKRLCGGVTRREMLGIGGLGLAGMTLAELLHWREASAATPKPASFGKAKSVILLHLYGSPSQLEWADPKPEAPLEIRGELGSIPSSLPGCGVCELFPQMAKVMDRTTVLRSMTHPYPIHGVAFALTGVPAIDVAMELSPHDSRHWPFVGSVIDYLDAQRNRGAAARSVPGNMALPFPFSSQRVGEVPRAGPYAAFLGGQYNPVFTRFVGKATRGQAKELQQMKYEENDPYMGVAADSYFEVPSATQLPPEITLDRLNRRKSLLQQLDDGRREFAQAAAGQQLDRQRQMAFSLLTSDKLRHALDVRREPARGRELYGDMLFGQSCLAARRLIEAGSRVVTVFWDEYGLAGSGWDTHWQHYPRMKLELCPGFDRAWYALITDLDQRGLLDETLVVCTSEHGRTPKLNQADGGGRDHWSRAYTSLVAGGGVKRGHVVGATDKHGGDVVNRPISPKDLLATIYHLLGIDHHTILRDALNRPLPLVEGNVIDEAIA